MKDPYTEMDLNRSIPVTEEGGQVKRMALPEDYDLNDSVPYKEPIGEMLKENLKEAGKKTLETALNVFKVIRWPYWRFIEQPVSTIATALQEPEGKTVTGTLGKAFQGYVPFRKIPPEEYGNYGQIWRNYYKSLTKQEPPTWYIAMASYGTAMGVEPPVIKVAEKGAELALTRAVTTREAEIIKGAFSPLKAKLERTGIDTSKLHAEGNIIRLSEKSELYLNKHVSAVLRGDKIRVPRWAKIEKLPPPVVVDKMAQEISKVAPTPDILPVTGPEIVVPPPAKPPEVPEEITKAAARKPPAWKAAEIDQEKRFAGILKGTQKNIENELKSIDKQMRILEKEKTVLQSAGKSTREVDQKLLSLSKDYQYLDSKFAETIIGQPKLEEIKGEYATMKVKDILTQQEAVQRQAFKAGVEKESLRVSEMKVRARQKEVLSREIKGLADDINRLPSQSLPLEYKERIDEIKKGFDLQKRTSRTLARRDSMKQFVDRMAEQGEEINIPQEQLDMLEKVTLNEMTIDDLRAVHETVTRLAHLGKLKGKLLTSKRLKEFEAVKKDIVESVTRGEGLSYESSIVKALREQNKTMKQKSAEGLKDYIYENMRPELMINMLDGLSSGTATETVFNPLWESSKAELEGLEKTTAAIKDIHKDINLSEVFIKKYKVGRFEGMTKSNAMSVYAYSFNDHGLAHLEGSGITEKDIKEIERFLTDAEKKAVQGMIKYYDEIQYPDMDAVYSELEGVRLVKEDNYFPIDRLEDISFNKELEKNILESHYIRRAGVSKGMTKTRVESKKGFSEFDYFGTILRNMRKVEHYKAYARSVRDANKILINPEIKEAIQQKMGDKFYTVLEKWLKDVAYGGDRKALSSFENLATWLRTNYAVAVIGGNFVSVSKAPLSFMQGSERIGKYNALKAIKKFLVNPLKWNEWIDKKSTLMKFRPMRQERELMEMTAQRSVKGQIGKVTGYQAIREYSILPWTIADKTTCDIIWLGAYDSAISDGMTETKAVDYADMIIRRTQPMSGMLNLPDTFRGSIFQKMFTLFRNQPNQNFNLIAESVLKAKGGKQKFGKTANEMLFYWIIPAVFLGIISRKRTQKDFGEFAKDVLNGALGGLIGIGQITNFIAAGFMGTTTPLDSVMADVYSSVQVKDKWKKIDKILNILSKLTGFPYLGVKRLITGKPFGKSKEKKGSYIRF